MERPPYLSLYEANHSNISRLNMGGRFVDQLADGVAHESKVGYTSLRKRVKTQILKDAELVSRGKVDDAVWHFYRSNATGKIGPSEPLKKIFM